MAHRTAREGLETGTAQMHSRSLELTKLKDRIAETQRTLDDARASLSDLEAQFRSLLDEVWANDSATNVLADLTE